MKISSDASFEAKNNILYLDLTKNHSKRFLIAVFLDVNEF